MPRRYFESADEYNKRIEREINESTVQETGGDFDSQGILEGDDAYARRVAQDAYERTIETEQGYPPSKSLLETEDEYLERLQGETEQIVSDRSIGGGERRWYESEDSHRERIARLRASGGSSAANGGGGGGGGGGGESNSGAFGAIGATAIAVAALIGFAVWDLLKGKVGRALATLLAVSLGLVALLYVGQILMVLGYAGTTAIESAEGWGMLVAVPIALFGALVWLIGFLLSIPLFMIEDAMGWCLAFGPAVSHDEQQAGQAISACNGF